MKIKQTTTVTEIEADARDLRESQTLAQNMAAWLSRVFQNTEPFDDKPETEDDESAEAGYGNTDHS